MTRILVSLALACCFFVTGAESQVLPPAAPVATPATGIGQTLFTANWNASTNATAYIIDVATDTIFRQPVAGYSGLNLGNVLTLNVTGLTAETKYFYRVKASNAGGTSGNSNTITLTTVVATPPPPVATAASNIGQASFTANWGTSTGATAYLLDVATDSNFVSLVAGYGNANVGNVQASNVAGLAGGTTYYYRVRANNVGGTSGNSNTIFLTTIVTTPPPPVATAGTGVTQTSFSANWNASSGATAYLLDVASDTNFTSILTAYSNLNVGNVLTRSVTGLSAGTKYFYRVRGNNVGGTSGNSNIISLTTVVATPPAPVALAASGIGQTLFAANWASSAGATAYLLDVATDTNFTSILTGYNNLNVGNVLTRNVTGLSAATKYFYRVRGNNAGGTSGNSNIISLTTVVATPPAPVALAASGIGQTLFAANWTSSAGATSYLLDVGTDTNFTAILPAYNNLNVGNVLTRTVTGLSAGTKYFFRVRGNNIGGTSGNSNVVSVTTVVATPPAPVATTASNISPTSFTANWNAAPGATTYLLDVATDTSFLSFLPGYNNLDVGNVLARNITGLTPATAYRYRVRGSNAGGTSGNSNTVSVTSAGVPPPPPQLTGPANGSGGQPVALTLTWNPSAGSSTYVLQISTTPAFAPAFISDSTLVATSRSLSGLAGNTVYYWRVAGRNQYGVGVFSSPAFSFSTVTTTSVTGSVLFPPNPAQSDYRMVSVPGLNPVAVADIAAGSGGSQGFDWRAFRASDSGLLAELGPLDQLSPGEGVWLIRKNTLNITKSSTMPPLQANGSYPVQIHGGWNILADPFDLPVRWSAVRAQNGLPLSDVIQGWSGTYAVDSIMEPFKAYYFFSPGSGVTSLALPYPLPSTQQLPPSTPPAIAWALHVAFASADNTDADCHLGVSPAAAPGVDSMEIRKPPLAFAGGEVFFSRPGPDGKESRFSTDYRPGVNGSEEWDIRITHPGGCNGILRFDGLDGIPSRYRVLMVEPIDGWPVDLRSQNAYRIQTPATALTVRLFVGVDSDLEQTLNDLSPVAYSLGQNYPNPFNPVTTIRYGLPQNAFVSLSVFNALGQQVRELVRGEQAAGFHEVKFDGSGLASGVYFYRIRAGGFVGTKRLLLLR